jgi:hypothetical protein
VEATDQSTDEQEDVTDGKAPGADEEDGEEDREDDERPTQTFEATIVRLDRKAAESLARLAGL